MEEQNKWNYKDIYIDKSMFDEDKEKLKDILEEIYKYKGKVTSKKENLLKIYELYSKALGKLERLYAYRMLQYHTDMKNDKKIKNFKDVEKLDSIFEKKTSFIEPEILSENEETIKIYFKEEKKLKKYQRTIQNILKEKEHTLTKKEEEIIANYQEIFKAPKNIFTTLLNTEIKFGKIKDEDGKEVELTRTNYISYVESKNEKVRKQAFKTLYNEYSKYINTITEIYLTSVKKDAMMARVRKYNSSLERAVKKDEASIKVYNTLVESVNKHLEINHRFIEIKKQLLNKEDLHMYDIYVNPFEEKTNRITFEEAKKETLEVLSVMGEEYIEKIKEAFENNWIDVYPKDGKRGGAYSQGIYGVHPYVLINFSGLERNVSTICHELGHAMHSYYSNENQNILDSKYTIFIAEIASTVNEILLSRYQIEKETDKTRKNKLIYDLLEMIRTTLFRQTMFAEFEQIIHEKVEEGESLSSKDLNEEYYKLNQKYFGKNIIVDKEIQYEWAKIPHFYRNFYVYKYSTGVVAAITIANNIIQEGEPYMKRYLNMLKMGRSINAIKLLKTIDVDLEDKNTYEDAIKWYFKNMKKLDM